MLVASTIALALAAGVAGLPSGGLSPRQSLTEANDLTTDFTSCKPVSMIFARATTEPGNIGITVGPQLKSALQSKLPGQVAWQGVDYQANWEGDAQAGLPGGKIAVSTLNAAYTKCPEAKILVAGYSEGAMVAHWAASGADTAAKAKIVALVTFGDPFRGASMGVPEDKIKNICAPGDKLCSGAGISISAGHLSYGSSEIQDATTFIGQAVNGAAGGSTSTMGGSASTMGGSGSAAGRNATFAKWSY